MKNALLKEKNTVHAMIHLYCKENHRDSDELCQDCSDLYDYAMKRLENCPYGVEKPSCSKCTTHCYKPEMQKKVRDVMRYSGPRMILHHPVMAVDHLIKKIK